MSPVGCQFWAVAATTALLPGCLGDLGASTVDVASAETLLGNAAASAAREGKPAQLLGMFTLETASPDDLASRNLPPWLVPFLEPDPDVGDGNAAAWGYVFGHEESAGDGHGHPMAGLLVVVGADGKERYRDAPGPDFPLVFAAAIAENWSVDSTEASETVRGDLLAPFASVPDAYVFASLAHRVGTVPAWMFEAGRTSSGDGAVAAVDARDGLRLRMGTRDPWAPTPTESGTLSGTANTNGGAVGSFAIRDLGHKQLEFYVEVPGSGGGVSQSGPQIEFVAQGPQGQEFPFHWDGSGGTNQAWFQFDAPNVGDWTLEATLAEGDDASFEIRWCALGATRCV